MLRIVQSSSRALALGLSSITLRLYLSGQCFYSNNLWLLVYVYNSVGCIFSNLAVVDAALFYAKPINYILASGGCALKCPLLNRERWSSAWQIRAPLESWYSNCLQDASTRDLAWIFATRKQVWADSKPSYRSWMRRRSFVRNCCRFGLEASFAGVRCLCGTANQCTHKQVTKVKWRNRCFSCKVRSSDWHECSGDTALGRCHDLRFTVDCKRLHTGWMVRPVFRYIWGLEVRHSKYDKLIFSWICGDIHPLVANMPASRNEIPSGGSGTSNNILLAALQEMDAIIAGKISCAHLGSLRKKGVIWPRWCIVTNVY